jgi:putative hydrolase of the HAD superfamily
MIKALMVDVDGVLVHGRPADGRHWASSLEADLGVRSADLQCEFFDVHWNEIVVGRAGLMERLPAVLQRIAPHLEPERLIAYWFSHDARLSVELLHDLAHVRAAGIGVYLATNQERMRADYLMETLGLAEHVDGMHYSARLGARKPDREFFDRIVAAMGVQAGELLLIDDAVENVNAAAAAGWNVIHWRKETSLRQSLPSGLAGDGHEIKRRGVS